ncbi:bifunctional diguanylate cyclase/phosphodiesterase [Marinobacterium lutimaris]|uniref:Diguanylate cyclase (GGDEF) domain-containing protein n=1 Tax=Marinobacterium lutimaris TaxID=568106 RepID=A0A1H6DLP2_9GAMM|nr:bifunctional diguanylate cyclase/phosphodiesterase [Marinobacterium lutimaris]SEG86114.1 diguanylate cyclase (GGDEF) domain-containing protein [Marinobacterium lutimaris]
MAKDKGYALFFRTERGLIATLFILYFIATLTLTGLTFRASQVEQLSQTSSTLLTAARSGGHLIGRYFHDLYGLNREPGQAQYRMIVATLDQLVADLPDVEYVYSMDVVGEKAFFIVSNETHLDLQRGTPSTFYNPYGSAPEELFEAYHSKTAIFTPVYTNEWGTFRSAFVPTQRSDGSYFVMAADMKVDGPNTLLMHSLELAALVSLLGLAPIYPLLHLYHQLRQRRERELEKELYYDPITGLPRIAKMEADLAENEQPMGGILINLDEFHAVNTLFGYDVGDHLLFQVAEALRAQLPADTTLYRSQVDEYFILLRGYDESRASNLASRLLASVFEPIKADDQRRITLTARAGIVLNEKDPVRLQHDAREAMDEASRNGRALVVFNEALRPENRYETNLHWLNEINEAFRHNRVQPWFQPILDANTGQVRHYEALARLLDGENRVHTPFHFLPVIRKSHLYRQLTCAIIDQSFSLFGPRSSSLSINLTRYDLIDEETINYLLREYEHQGLQGRLIIEVIESESIGYQDEVLRVLKRLKEAGIQLAIDDFGSGYSNFDHMLKIDADYLKIDGSLIRSVLGNHKASVLVEAIISFASSLDIPLIAEFVEDEQILDYLKARDVRFMQGYVIGRPAPADQLQIA